MRRVIVIVLCLFMWARCFADVSQRDTVPVSCAYHALWTQTGVPASLQTYTMDCLAFKPTDKGLFGGQAGKSRIYCDITFPTLTPDCLVDVGMAMSRMIAPLSMAPRWFSMFSPTACPADELFGAAKCQTAIMLTMRTYF